MKKKVLLPICLFALTLSACANGSGSLFGESNVALDSNQISEVLLGYLASREHVSGADISISLNDNVISDSALLFSDQVNSETSITYNRYSNSAIGFTFNEDSETTSSTTGFSYSSEVAMSGYSWLALDTEDEKQDRYNHYTYIETSYNNGYKSTSSSTIGNTSSDRRSSYWSAYAVDTFFDSLVSTYMDYRYLSGDGRTHSLYNDFVSKYSLFDDYTSLSFVSKDDLVLAYATELSISSLTNPLYPNDKSKDIATMSIKSISYTLENDPIFGYILTGMNASYTYQLLESLDNVYLSNPWVVETYSFDLEYLYSSSLTSTALPSIETSEASFYPVLSTYELVENESTGSDSSSGGILEGGTSVSEGSGEGTITLDGSDDTYLDEEGNALSYSSYVRISGTRYSDIVNMTSYYQSEDSSFTGSAYELEIEVNNTSNAYSFSTSLSYDDNNEQIYNLWGYSDINASSFSSSLLEEVSDSETENLFRISRQGTYSFVLLFDESHNLVSISMYVLNMD